MYHIPDMYFYFKQGKEANQIENKLLNLSICIYMHIYISMHIPQGVLKTYCYDNLNLATHE